MPLAEDLEPIEKQMRQLQIEWDKFFGGIEKKPPTDLKSRLEAEIPPHANSESRNTTERCRYQTMVAKYNTLSELWSKTLRAREEGKAFGVHGLKADVLPPPAPPAPAAAAPRAMRPAGGGEFRVANPESDMATVKALYENFLAARQKAGEH